MGSSLGCPRFSRYRREHRQEGAGLGPGLVPLDEALLSLGFSFPLCSERSKGRLVVTWFRPLPPTGHVWMGKLRLGEETGFLPEAGPGPQPCTWVCPLKCAHT